MQLLTYRALALVLTIVSFGTAPALAAEPKPRRPAAQEVWARTELYFGTASPLGEVTDEKFAAFVDGQITPLFPDGLTLLTGYGQFLNSSGTLVKERSKVLILFYPLHTRDANKNIQKIREAYKDLYRQESVLRVDGYVVLSF